MHRCQSWIGVSVLVWVGLLVAPVPARAQLPDLPELGLPGPEAEAPDGPPAAIPDPTPENPEATVAEAVGPIDVEDRPDDATLHQFLQRMLPKVRGVRRIEVEVESGVVTLTGHVEDERVRDRLRDVTLRVGGVIMVANHTLTDAQVLTARQRAVKQLNAYADLVARNWLLVGLALAIFFASIALARVFGRYDDVLLAPLSGNVLLRSVIGSVLVALIVVAGLFSALSVLGLAQPILSIVGLAGVVALALSFAFRDIAENFIASVLLGLRRPFRVGDFVRIGEHGGVVKALNTRATILVTLEGHHVRIPNATVFKEVLINLTASTSVRETFDVMIPYEVSTTAAQEAIASALRAHTGILPDPPARTLVEALEPGGVVLRSYFWRATKGVDRFKLLSDARLKAKVALQSLGITPPPTSLSLTVAERVPVQMLAADGPPTAPDGRRVRPSPEQVQANLRHDSQAASRAPDATDVQEDTPERLLNKAEPGASDEGANLLNR